MSDGDLVGSLISQGETTKVDRKLQLDLEGDKGKFEFCKDVSAMANTYGGTGYLLIGVEDMSGAVIGIDPKSFDTARMQQVVNSRCHPHIDFSAKLVDYQGKTVGLITIPESTNKPHRVREGTKMATFVRRGDTTEQADTDEILSMFASSQAMDREDQFNAIMSPAEVVLVLSMVVSFYALIRPLTFSLGYSTASALSFDPVCLIMTVVVMVLVWFSKYLVLKDSVSLLPPWRRAVSIALLGQVLELLVVGIIAAFANTYPTSFRQLVTVPWDSLAAVEVVSSVTCLASFLLVEATFPRYLSLLRDLRPDDTRFGSPWATLGRFRHLSAMLRNKKFVALLFLFLVSATLIQSLDSEYGFFTPHIDATASPYPAGQILPYSPANYYLSIAGNLQSVNASGVCTVVAYESFNETVTVSIPKSSVLSIDSFTIPNPSNVSRVISSPESSQLDVYSPSVWDNLAVGNPNHLVISTAPSISNVSDIQVGFANQSRGSARTLSLLYFQRASAPVTCEESITYHPLGNGSASVTSQYILDNHGQSTDIIGLIQVRDSVEWLNNDPLFANPRQATLYWNNESITYSTPNYQEIYPAVVVLQPAATVNYTIVATGPGVYN